MMFLLFLAGALWFAYGLTAWRGLDAEEVGPELAGLIVLLGFAILIGTSWALALAHLLTSHALWVCTGILWVGAGGMFFAARGRRNGWRLEPLLSRPLPALILVSFLVFSLYLIVRGLAISVMEFDALTYHFPKAVEIMRAHSIPRIVSGDFRVAYFPWNYELLLADGLILAGGDHFSFLIGLLATFGFCAYAYAIFRKAWPSATGLEALLGVVFLAATPVLILQSADYKNDVLFSFLLISLLYWLTLWCQSGQGRQLFLAFLSLGLCFGTKATVLFLLPVLPVVGWYYRDRFVLAPGRQPLRMFLLVAAAVSLLVLTGAAWPLFNYHWCGRLLGDTAMVGGLSGYEANAVPRYNGWANLWTFPLLVFLRPFSSHPGAVWVFWKHQYWWWPTYHPIYSHFGWLCSCLLLLLPVGIREHFRRTGPGKHFRSLLTLFTVAFVLLSLPQRYRVDGMFCGFPRYLLCLPLIAALWTLLPVLVRLREAGYRRLAIAAGLGLIGYFLGQSYFCFKLDVTKPFAMVLDYLADPNVKPTGQMAFGLDRVAGPADAIAFDSGFGGMVYPLYGAKYTRPLCYLWPAAGIVAIPPETQWVVIDRSWNVGWSHPGVTHTGDFWLPFKRAVSPEDLALYNQMVRDPAFVLVYNNTVSNQFVFQRQAHGRP